MSETLYIRLLHAARDAAIGNVTWLVRGGDGPARPGSGDLAQAAAQAAGRRVAVLVPGEDVTLTRVRVPTQQRQRLLRAVPFALEDHLAADVDDLHFALGRQEGDGDIAVAVADRERMDGWLAALQSAEIRPASMMPDILAIPLTEGEWTLLLEQGRALLRTGAGSGYALDLADPARMLVMALGQAAEARPKALRILVNPEEGAAVADSIIDACAGEQLPVRTEHWDGDPLPLLAAGLAQGDGIDLLQGDYSRREQLGRLWRVWRPTAAMLAVLFLLQGGMSIHAYARLSGESAALGERIAKLYRETFPEARKVVNPKVQMERQLEELLTGGARDGLVTLLAGAGPALQQVKGLELNGLRYKQGALEVDLTLADLQSLDGLKQALLARGGLRVDIDAASARGDKVEGRLRIQEAGS